MAEQPMGASAEVLQHHINQHKCDIEDAPIVLMACPCEGPNFQLLLCPSCMEPLLFATARTGTPCPHAEAYFEWHQKEMER